MIQNLQFLHFMIKKSSLTQFSQADHAYLRDVPINRGPSLKQLIMDCVNIIALMRCFNNLLIYRVSKRVYFEIFHSKNLMSVIVVIARET